MRLSCGLYEVRNIPKRGRVFTLPLFYVYTLNNIECRKGSQNTNSLSKELQ